jgi:alkylation response protein AidB-like acyl-CoA dehydrogenase
VAKRLAASFEKDAAIRDRDRIWPVAELDAFSQSGLWSINVPRAFGGPEGSYATLSKVVEIISAADSSIEIQSVDSTPSVQRRIVNVQGIVSDDCIFPAY